VFVGVLEGGSVVGFIGLLLGASAVGEGGDAKGGKGECPFAGTWERVCVGGFVVALLGGDGEEGWCAFVGVRVLKFVEVFGEREDVEDGDAETGDGGSAFVVGGVEKVAKEQMMGMEVGAAIEGGVVSYDFGGGESLDWEIGDDGESETDG
jgi:hypothetical protein